MRLFTLLRSLSITLALTAISGTANALSCQGPPLYIGTQSNGALYVNAGHGIWYVCNLSTNLTNGGTTVNAEVCRAWYATLLAQRKGGGEVAFYFATYTACNQVGHWVLPTVLPYHMEVIN